MGNGSESQDVDNRINLVFYFDRVECGEIIKISFDAEVWVDAGLLRDIANVPEVSARTRGISQNCEGVLVALHANDGAHEGGFSAS